jgi:hypothetical protein
MHAVVGCSDCSALWVVADDRDQATATCPRCGTRHQRDRLKRFVETPDEAHAREVRASMLAARQGESDAFAAVDSYADLEARLDEAGVDDADYLESGGVDPDAAREAGQRATTGEGGSRSRPEVVRAALRELDGPDRAAVREYAAERGVPADAVEDLLDRLHERGELTERDGSLRLL